MDREYAVVFAGGGTKGSYQVGVIKALKELNIKIVAVSGASIGTINGAMLVQGDEKKLESIYSNIRMQDILKISEKRKINANENLFKPKNALKLLEEYVKNKGISNEPLRKLLEDNIDIDKLYNSEIDFGFITFDTDKRHGVELFKEDIPREKMIDYLLASSCFPIFKPQVIGEHHYLDGGLSNNMPISLLLEKGYKNIILIDVMGIGLIKRNTHKDIYFKVIKPEEDLGGTFDFDLDNIKKNIKLGYLDTLKSFHKLIGNRYYFPKEEFFKLLNDYTLKEIRGFEKAAEKYKMDRYKKYSAKEFKEELLANYKEEKKGYEKVRIRKNIKSIIHIKQIVSSGYTYALIDDVMVNFPSLLYSYKGLFKDHIDAAASLCILNRDNR